MVNRNCSKRRKIPSRLEAFRLNISLCSVLKRMTFAVDDLQFREVCVTLIGVTTLHPFVISDSSNIQFMKGCVYKPKRTDNGNNNNNNNKRVNQ